MWKIFVLTFNNIVPLFVIAFTGYALRRLHVLPESVADPLNSLAFRLLIPCLCFRSMLAIEFDLRYLWLMLYALATFLISIPVMCRIASGFVARRDQIGVVVQASFRSNMSAFSLPLLISIAGENSAGPLIMVMAMAALLFNALSIVVLGRYSEAAAAGNTSAREILREVFRNPIIIGAVLGILARLLPFSLPAVVLKPIFDLSACSAPITMLSIGLRFHLKRLSENRRPIMLACFLKLIALPLIWTAGCIPLGFEGPFLCAIFLTHACPSTTSCVPTAVGMGCDGELAGDIVLTQTAVSFVTLFCGIYLIRLLGLI